MRIQLLALLLFSISALPAANLPLTAEWKPVTGFPDIESRNYQHWTTWPNGDVLVNARMPDYSYQLYQFDAANGSWRTRANPPTKLLDPCVCLLADGRVLFVHERTHPKYKQTHIFDPAANTWTRVADAPIDRQYADAFLLTDGRVYVVGGEWAGWGIKDGYIYDPVTDKWSDGPDLHTYFQLGTPYISGIRLPDLRVWTWDEHKGVSILFDPNDRSFQTLGFSGFGREAVASGFKIYSAKTVSGTSDGTWQVWVSELRPGPSTLFDADLGTSYKKSTVRLFSCDIAGQDWLGYFNQPSRAKNTDPFEKTECRIYNPQSGAWAELPSVQLNQSLGGRPLLVQQSDGFLLTPNLRLTLTSTEPPLPAMVADELNDLVIPENNIISFDYHVIGNIPAEGVTVITERISGGSADVRVVKNSSVHVRGRSQVVQVYLATMTDADTDDESATIRVRIQYPDGSPDTHARTFTVTVPDTFSIDPGGSHIPGDVNGDGVVNAQDLQEVVDNFGTSVEE